MKIGLLSNGYKDPGFEHCRRAQAILKRLGCSVAVMIQKPEISDPPGSAETGAAGGAGCPQAASTANRHYSDRSYDPDSVDLSAVQAFFRDCDLILSLGGDGTFLNAVHAAYPNDIPVAGVNLGSLGFLAEILPDQLEDGLKRLVSGDCSSAFRTVLDVCVLDAENRVLHRDFALNEAVLSRGHSPRILPIELWIDGGFTELVPSDGLMVSTPTGSTGYAMAAGGPIIQPSMELMLITPICPHTLHNRSYIIAPDSTVEFRIPYYPYHPVLSIDGQRDIRMDCTQSVLVRKAGQPLRVARLNTAAFFSDLPQKISGRGMIRRTEVPK